MDIRPLCLNCETAVAKVKGGYSCPKCHSLYTIAMEMIWDATSKHKGRKDGTKKV
jgi:Zn finger protein HypA/HybF involved in hydrogenase expression